MVLRSYPYTCRLVSSPGLTFCIGILVSLLFPLNPQDFFELIIFERSNSPALAFNNSFTITAYLSVLQNHICQGEWKKPQRKDGNIGWLPVCVVAYKTKFNCAVEKWHEKHKQCKTRLWECFFEKGKHTRNWNVEMGGDGLCHCAAEKTNGHPTSRQERITVHACSVSLKPSANRVQSKSNWWEQSINY